MKSVRVVVSGRVQGVWFRAWTAERAADFGLDGWVRNRMDGTVEAVFSGDPASVDSMLEACAKGPPLAQVATLDVTEGVPPEAKGFAILPTE